MSVATAYPTPGFAIPPYHVETFPIGACVCNKNGFNCLRFSDRPGAKFTSLEDATQIAQMWNQPEHPHTHQTMAQCVLGHGTDNARRSDGSSKI